MQFNIYWRKKHYNFPFIFLVTFFMCWMLFWIAGGRKQTHAAPGAPGVLKPRDCSDIENFCGDTLSSPFICSLVNEPVN